ncbi:E2F-associated phosphoprotein [Trachemys scripta elegans]|uniref:E2F associated phosphoprotein n=1 Tax=Terrapene triunguis TaxID=2587831 RepID=A0A674J2W0_9SAUR|nr:E2F-associated phosphoprotein [Terrapene carolina triunguis]XP_034625204.1 E2F-associated phosphoprotein [Trachemys scripta elegans]
MSRLQEDDDPYVIEEPSDEEPGQSSSEDEVDVLLYGTPDQKRKLIRECLTGESESSSEDEFQKEMEAELNCTMKTMEGKWKSLETGTSSSTGQAGTVTTTKYYDDIYFDSDSEDEDKVGTQAARKKKRHQQRRIPTNDELLYDPEEDDRDQEWVDSQRRGYQNIRRTQQQQSKPPAIPNSDAVLNCPACMTTLCFDCQRHESYKTQYRAMFVMNCSVNKEEVLKYKGPVNKKIKKGHKKMKHSNEITTVQANQEEEEVYHPVKCTECSTEVAVLDKDEVFHFFNVLASHC